MRASLILATIFSSMIALSGCAGDGPIAGSAQALKNAQASPYTLSAGDKIHIVVFGENNLTADYTITPEGTIGFPLVGDIPAAGLTTAQLQKSVTDTLATRYVQNPRVTVNAASLRPFYILGEVNKPGQYSYVPDLTALAAVATAQGFTYRADMSYIFLRHAHDASERQIPLTATTMIEPGDTIRITQRYF
jgi:protein involved in polysaccharide export with SLBB domain